MLLFVYQGRIWLCRFYFYVYLVVLWEFLGQKVLVGFVIIYWINEDFSLKENSFVFSFKNILGFIVYYKDEIINKILQIMRKYNNLNYKYSVDYKNQ